jgi:hypothetical protein
MSSAYAKISYTETSVGKSDLLTKGMSKTRVRGIPQIPRTRVLEIQVINLRARLACINR